MRNLLSLIVFVAFCLGGYWVWTNNDTVRDFVGEKTTPKTIVTIEKRVSPIDLMDQNRQTLIMDARYSFNTPEIHYVPYLLMNVSTTTGEEGMILWGLTDGEMVINADTWETTKGFGKALREGVTPEEIRLLQALDQQEGSATVDVLKNQLHTPFAVTKKLLYSTINKDLVVQDGDNFFLYNKKDHYPQESFTENAQDLSLQTYKHAHAYPPTYSPDTLTKGAEALNLNVLGLKTIYLPIIVIGIKNPDESIRETSWNGFTGKRYLNRLK